MYFRSKLFKDRKVDQRTAQLNFEESYRKVAPSEWNEFQIKQVRHLIKWASVGFNIRDSVTLSKSLLVRELGQRGYVKHIHSVFPILQGHNLGAGQTTVYDYRALLRELVRWINQQGWDAMEEFKLFFRAVMAELESEFKIKMGWFYKKVSFWFGKFTDTFKLIRSEQAVTTIQESYKIRCWSLRRGLHPEPEAVETSSRLTLSDAIAHHHRLKSQLAFG